MIKKIKSKIISVGSKAGNLVKNVKSRLFKKNKSKTSSPNHKSEAMSEPPSPKDFFNKAEKLIKEMETKQADKKVEISDEKTDAKSDNVLETKLEKLAEAKLAETRGEPAESKGAEEIKPATGIKGLFKVFKARIKSKKKKLEERKSNYDKFRDSFNNSLRKSNFDLTLRDVDKTVFRVCIVIAIVLAISSLFFIGKFHILNFILFFVFMGVVAPAFIYILIFFLFKLYLDYVVFKRKEEIEKVLPDFLQLTAANVNAGIILDKALWLSVRPKFGILTKEIETIAKETITGRPIEESLVDFAKKYDSETLTRVVNLILEGLRSGGRMGDLLNKIALNIREIDIMKKEMSASVMTYVIFITVASIMAAPVLLGLSHELIVVVRDIMAGLGGQNLSAGSISFNMSGESISIVDFRIFAIVNIFFSGLFASFIVAAISKGNALKGLKVAPFFIMIGIALFVISFKILHVVLGSFF